jgi:hypothetical protein
MTPIRKMTRISNRPLARCGNEKEKKMISKKFMAHLEALSQKWMRYMNVIPDKMTDKDVEKAMSGHAMFDDPPKGYTKRDLIMWGRGYLHAEAVQTYNAGATIDMLIKAIKEGEKK